MRGLNLDQLRALAEVVERGSFSAAARHLNLTQPAVSLQVRQLEQRLGVRLVERIGRRIAPTPAGSDLLRHARQIDGAIAVALEAVAQHASGVTGQVRLGASATACIHVLPPTLRLLRQRFPGLEIRINTGNTSDMLRALEDNALDLGLVTLPAPGRMFQVTPLIEDDFLAVAPAGQADLPARLTPKALAALPLVLSEPGANTRRCIDVWFGRAGLQPRPVMELGSTEAIKEVVAAGLGCSLLPAMALPDRRQRTDLLCRPVTPRLSRRLGLVLRRDKLLTHALREVIAALKALG